MHKASAFVLILGLTGCSGTPLVSNGLSSEAAVPVAEALPEPTPLPAPKPARRVARYKAVEHVAATKPPAEPAGDGDDDAADRATKALDQEVHRLETAARQATNSICRGC